MASQLNNFIVSKYYHQCNCPILSLYSESGAEDYSWAIEYEKLEDYRSSHVFDNRFFIDKWMHAKRG